MNRNMIKIFLLVTLAVLLVGIAKPKGSFYHERQMLE